MYARRSPPPPVSPIPTSYFHLLTFILSHLPVFLPSCIPSFLLTFRQTFLPTLLLAYSLSSCLSLPSCASTSHSPQQASHQVTRWIWATARLATREEIVYSGRVVVIFCHRRDWLCYKNSKCRVMWYSTIFISQNHLGHNSNSSTY